MADTVIEYLENLTWDGVPRAEALLVDHLGAVDDEHTRAVTADWLKDAVRRRYEPGRAVGPALALVGPHGVGKSSLLRALSAEWHESADGFGTSAVLNNEMLQRAYWNQGWVMELTDMRVKRPKDLENFLQTRVDWVKQRRHMSARYERNFVCVATATDDAQLICPEAFRKVVCPGPYVPLTPEDADQVWAEVKTWLG